MKEILTVDENNILSGKARLVILKRELDGLDWGKVMTRLLKDTCVTELTVQIREENPDE